jgi:hypothetical protein
MTVYPEGTVLRVIVAVVQDDIQNAARERLLELLLLTW